MKRLICKPGKARLTSSWSDVALSLSAKLYDWSFPVLLTAVWSRGGSTTGCAPLMNPPCDFRLGTHAAKSPHLIRCAVSSFTATQSSRTTWFHRRFFIIAKKFGCRIKGSKELLRIVKKQLQKESYWVSHENLKHKFCKNISMQF